MVNNKSL